MTVPTDPNAQPTTPTPQPAGTGAPPPATPPTNGQGETPTQETPAPQNWEEYLGGLPEDIQGLYNDHTSGLRSALDSERQQRRDLERQLRELSPQLEEGSQARQQVDRITGELESANSRAEFYEEAALAGISDFRLAWLAVQDDPDNFTRRGRVQWDVLREQKPALFRQTQPSAPPGHAGAGTQSPPAAAEKFDDILRRAAFGS